jgi:hypothetical protein
MKYGRSYKMNKGLILILLSFMIVSGCKNRHTQAKRVALAEVGNVVLYLDEIPKLIKHGVNESDSVALFQNYINKWAKRQLLLRRAEENLSPVLKEEIDKQLEDTRSNLIIYQYQRQMILEKLDTVLTDAEIENYYAANEKSFILSSNIVKALFIKLPLETPDLNKIRSLARSNTHNDLQQLETICYQFAEKFDDFNEEWVPMERLTVELHQNIENEDNFLKRNTFYETSDSISDYLVSIRDYRLRYSLAPFEYVKDDIKRIIWNNRRFEFIQSLENGIYNDALKENGFKILDIK